MTYYKWVGTRVNKGCVYMGTEEDVQEYMDNPKCWRIDCEVTEEEVEKFRNDGMKELDRLETLYGIDYVMENC